MAKCDSTVIGKFAGQLYKQGGSCLFAVWQGLCWVGRQDI